jgi:ribosomal-protein-alanine N-acetyltransferase
VAAGSSESRSVAPSRRASVSGLYIRPLEMEDAPALLDLRVRNRASFRPFEPVQGERHFTLEGQWDEIATCAQDARLDRRYAFGIFLSPDDEIVGRIALSNVARGAWQNATVGYYVAVEHQGRGYATEALRLVLRFAFEEAGLHRVQAGVVPENRASARVLEKAGFRREGMAERYINIDGRWRDHLIFAITKEDWDAGAG